MPCPRNRREGVEGGVADQLGPDLGANVVGDGDVEPGLAKDRGDPLGSLAGPAGGFAEHEFVAAGPPDDAGDDPRDPHIDDRADHRAGRQCGEQGAVGIDRGDRLSPERAGLAVEVPPWDAVDRWQ